MPRPPWLHILRSGPFWGLLTTHMGYNFIATTTGTFLPIYLNDVLKLDVTQVTLDLTKLHGPLFKFNGNKPYSISSIVIPLLFMLNNQLQLVFDSTRVM